MQKKPASITKRRTVLQSLQVLVSSKQFFMKRSQTFFRLAQ